MNAFGRSRLQCSDFLSKVTQLKIKNNLKAFHPRQVKEIAWSVLTLSTEFIPLSGYFPPKLFHCCRAHARHDLDDPELFNAIIYQCKPEIESMNLPTLVPLLWYPNPLSSVPNLPPALTHNLLQSGPWQGWGTLTPSSSRDQLSD